MGAYKRAREENAAQAAEIKKQIEEAGKSQYNEATVSQQASDYYKDAAEAYAKSKLAAEQGMTPEEINLATNQNAQALNFGAQNALRAGGGNASGAVGAIFNSANNDFSTKLAAQNQDVKRQNRAIALSYLQNLGQASDVYQNVNNLNFQKETLVQQALGQALQNNQANLNALRQARMANNAQLISSGIQTAGTVAGAAAGAA